MQERNITNRLTIGAAAAAVALALGTLAHAQQPRSANEQNRESAQQQRQEPAGDRASETAQTQQRTQSQQRSAQSSSANQHSAGGGLANLGDEHDDLSTFAKALETAGLTDSLSDGTSYTIFAPTDEAFESMRGDTADLMSAENRDELVALLRAHIVADDVDEAQARQLEEAKTIDGETVALKTENGKLMVEDATVVESDIERGNVRIHSIDKVLDAPTRTAVADEDDRERG